MKKLSLTQVYSSRYTGPVTTPAVEKYVYKVTQVVGATRPCIDETLIKDEVDNYCESEDWTVTIK